MRNSLGPERVKKLVYIKTNCAAVADVVWPCESDDDSDSDSPFPVDSDLSSSRFTQKLSFK
jgi:hypothetical protein